MTEGKVNGIMMDRDSEMILRVLIRTPSSPIEIARMYDIPIAKCHRLLTKMEKAMLVSKKEAIGKETVYCISSEQVSVELRGVTAKLRLRTLLDLSESVEKRVRIQH